MALTALRTDIKRIGNFLLRWQIKLDFRLVHMSQSYDAAALILLTMQSASSTDGNVFKNKVFEVANSPGEDFSGELVKALGDSLEIWWEEVIC